MILGLLLVAYPETPVVVEPGVDALHDPAPRRVMAGPFLLSNLADMREVPQVHDPLLAVAVCLVEAEMLNHDRPRDDYPVDGVLQDDGVMPVRTNLHHAQRVASHVGQDGLLDAALASVGGISANALVRLTALGKTGVHALDNPGHFAAFVGVLGHGGPHLAEQPTLRPTLKPAMAGRRRREPLRQLFPLAARPHAVEHSVQQVAKLCSRSSGRRSRCVVFEDGADKIPKVIRDLPDDVRVTTAANPLNQRHSQDPKVHWFCGWG